MACALNVCKASLNTRRLALAIYHGASHRIADQLHTLLHAKHIFALVIVGHLALRVGFGKRCCIPTALEATCEMKTTSDGLDGIVLPLRRQQFFYLIAGFLFGVV
jgi:hypothetical protein